MIDRILIYNSGGGIGDALQILPFINALKNKGGLNRNLQISASVLSNISRLIQNFQLANANYEYAKLDGKYIRKKGVS